MANTKKAAGSHASTAHKKTHAEAGHLGGVAPHSCRGRQCSENKSHAGKKSTAHKSSASMWEDEE